VSDPTALTIARAARALADRRLSASELVEAHLERIARVDPELNAFLCVLAEDARRAAAESDARYARGAPRSPLDGIPIALKDNIDQRGIATTNGLARGPVASRDARVVDRLRAAGAVLLGKLNMHECALGGTTRNPHHGATHNPCRHGFTPGGSSGGSAAAVAARLAMAALGTDTLGSVRLPAAYCGVVGFKPTLGGVSTDGVAPLSRSLDHVGPLARTVEDAQLVFEAIAEPEPAAGESSPPRVPLAALRLAVIGNFRAVRADAPVAQTFHACLDRLRRQGLSIETIELSDFDPFALRRAALLVIEAEGASASDARGTAWGAPSAQIARMLDYGRQLAPQRLEAARAALAAASRSFVAAALRVDAIVSLTAPQAAFSLDAAEPVNQAEFTAIANVGGAPALSMPFADLDGLPLGLQLIGAPRRDRFVLEIGRALEPVLGAAIQNVPG